MKTDFEDLMGRIGMKHHCFDLILDHSGVAALPPGEPFGWSAALLGMPIAT
jgi:hypothetical protein